MNGTLKTLNEIGFEYILTTNKVKPVYYNPITSPFPNKMLNLFSLNQEKKDNGGSRPGKKNASAAQLRITKDVNELELPRTCKVDFPNEDDLLNFKLKINPDEGFYRHGQFTFSFKIGEQYPHEPPKVKCEQKIYHPNIDLEGNVCLNILREDWKPVLTINSVVYGLQYLFLEPNPDDPLNKEAAVELQGNRRLFESNVQKTMKGGNLNGVYFDRVVR